MASALQNLLTKTGARALDFDIEGGAVSSVNGAKVRNEAIVLLQKKFSDLKVSFTLPVRSAKWGPITEECLDLLRVARESGVKIALVNLMVMDIYLAGVKWSEESIAIMEKARVQTGLEYSELGATFMAGKNDDGSVFSVEDCRTLVEFARAKGLGLVSYWALQRDQSVQNGLQTSTMYTQEDYAFFKACNTLTVPSIPSIPSTTQSPGTVLRVSIDILIADGTVIKRTASVL
jgi:chitinase